VVKFKCVHGHSTGRVPIAEWKYAPDDYQNSIPQQPMPLKINLWLQRGDPPADSQPVEVIIKDVDVVSDYVWELEGETSILTDAQGWNQPHYYKTIRLADVDGDGRAELVARGADEVMVFKAR
jgi:hypothetical protein